jgi:hypothetical protein
MTTRSTLLSCLAGFLALAAMGAGVLSFRGTGPAVLTGVALGVLGGAGGSVLEVVLVRRALSRARGAALSIVLGGFLFRLAVLVGGALLLHSTGYADAAAFALCFLAGFLSSLPVLAAVVAGERSPTNGEARG